MTAADVHVQGGRGDGTWGCLGCNWVQDRPHAEHVADVRAEAEAEAVTSAIGASVRLPDGRLGVVQERCRFNQRVARESFGAEADRWTLLDVDGALERHPAAGLVVCASIQRQAVPRCEPCLRDAHLAAAVS